MILTYAAENDAQQAGWYPGGRAGWYPGGRAGTLVEGPRLSVGPYKLLSLKRSAMEGPHPRGTTFMFIVENVFGNT